MATPVDPTHPMLHPPHRAVSGGLARAAVFGINDGLVSNVSLVIGFAGSGANASLVRLAGIAGAIAGGVSMGAGEWISVSAQNELTQREVAVEQRSLEDNEPGELAELRAIYESYGMQPTTARNAAAEVMQSREVALTVHMREELGIDRHNLPSPWKAAGISLVCFLVGALLPVLPWYFDAGDSAMVTSIVLGVIAAAGVGWTIGAFADRGRVVSMIRQVAILLVACAVTYSIGTLLNVSTT